MLDKSVDFQKSPSSDFVARGRPLRGQTMLAPLAKRSTCSKSTKVMNGRMGKGLALFIFVLFSKGKNSYQSAGNFVYLRSHSSFVSSDCPLLSLLMFCYLVSTFGKHHSGLRNKNIIKFNLHKNISFL